MAYIPEKEKILCYHYIEERKKRAARRGSVKKSSPLRQARQPRGRRQRAAQRGAFKRKILFYVPRFFAIFRPFKFLKMLFLPLRAL